MFCLEHTLLLLQPFISCKYLETFVLPDAVIVPPRIAVYGLVEYPPCTVLSMVVQTIGRLCELKPHQCVSDKS